MKSKQELLENIKQAEAALRSAKEQLQEYEESPENNVYSSLEDAQELEEILLGLAYLDCEGSYNVGNDVYEREFMVDDEYYIAILECEYNRHDKTYYYVDEHKFRIEKKYQ